MIVLNHGTLNHQGEDTNIITLLARALNYHGLEGGSDKLDFMYYPDGVYVTNGVGSDRLDKDLARLGKNTRRVSKLTPQELHPGVKDGREVEDNVEDYVAALDQFYATNKRLPTTIDFVGYSRGAVTCFKMLNKEGEVVERFRARNVEFSPRYRIFAIDPVPGITGEANEHMWDGVEIGRAVEPRTNCFILLAEGERREAFTPMVPRQARLKGNKQVCDYDTMPGKHVAMSGCGGTHETPMFELIKDMAASFVLGSNGIRAGSLKWSWLAAMQIKEDWDKLDLYAKIMNKLYKKGSPHGGLMNTGHDFVHKAMNETSYKEGRKFHVVGGSTTTNIPNATPWGGADFNVTLGDAGLTLNDQLRTDKLNKRSLSEKKKRVFVNTAHKRLCNALLPGDPFNALHQMDKGNWHSQHRKTLKAVLQTKQQLAKCQNVRNWLADLLNDGPWQWSVLGGW